MTLAFPLFALPDVITPVTGLNFPVLSIDSKGRVIAASSYAADGSGHIVLASVLTGYQPLFTAQSPNVVYAGPGSGGAATPNFRAIVPADLTSALTTPPPIGGTTPAAITGTTINGTIITASTRFVGPIIAPTSDSTTALRFTKADGSTNVVVVDTTNSRVGIGGTPSTSFLDIFAASNANALTIFNSSLSGRGWILYPVTNGSNTDLRFWEVSGSSGNRITFQSGGSVGIGAASPTATLHIVSSAAATKGILFRAATSQSAALVDILEENGFSVASVAASGVTTVSPYNATTNTVDDALILYHRSSGTPTVGFGIDLRFRGDVNGASAKDMGRVRTSWTNATNLSQTSQMILSVYNVASEVDVLTLTSAGDAILNSNLYLTSVGPRIRFSSSEVQFITNDASAFYAIHAAGAAFTGNVVTNSTYQFGTTSGPILRAASATLAEIVNSAATDWVGLRVKTLTLTGSVIAPNADSTTALKLTKADGTTTILSIDSTNNRVGINQPAPGAALHVVGSAFITTGVFTSGSYEQLTGGVTAKFGTSTAAGVDIGKSDGTSPITITGSTKLLASDSATTTVANALTIDHATSGTPGIGYGTGIKFQGSDNGATNVSMGQIRTEWTSATNLSQVSKMVFTVYNVASAVDTLTIFPGNSSNVGVGAIASGYGGIGFGTTLTGSNYSLGGNGTDTFLNASSGGNTYFRVNNTTIFSHNNSGITIAEAVSILFGTTTGTKLGTATSQKLAFWNATPIVQPTTAIAAATFVANTSLTANDSATWDGYTIGQVVKALRNEGLLA